MQCRTRCSGRTVYPGCTTRAYYRPVHHPGYTSRIPSPMCRVPSPMCREEYPGQPLPTLGSLFLPWATSSYPGLPLPVKAGLPLTVKAGLPLTVKAGFPWCQSRLPVVLLLRNPTLEKPTLKAILGKRGSRSGEIPGYSWSGKSGPGQFRHFLDPWMPH